MPYVLSKYGPRGPEYVWVGEKPEKTPQTYEELKEAGYTPLLSRIGPQGPEYMMYQTSDPKQSLREYAESYEKPSPPAEPTPTTSLAYRQAVEGRVEMTPDIIEQEIINVYRQAPIEYTQVGPKYKKAYYAPTPEQEQQIISLAMQLPPEKRAKYIIEPKPEPKGIAETLASVRMEDVQRFFAVGIADIMGLKGEKREQYLQRYQQLTTVLQPRLVTGQPMPIFGEPVQTLGGVVAPAESLVYGGERIVSAFVTHHKPVTPRPPPTVSGGVVGAMLGSPRELQKVEEYGVPYAIGTVLGEAPLMYAVGKGAEKAWVVAKKVTPEFIKHPIYQTVRFGRVAKLAHKVKLAVPSYRGSRLDVFLAKHFKSYYKATGGIARGEVAIPPVPERIGMSYLRASKLAWEMTAAPRTGGVWIGKTVVTSAKKKAMLHLISRGGQVSIGYLRELSYDAEPYWRRGLLPFVTQQQATRMGIVPYVPKMAYTTGKKGISMFGGGLVATVPRLVVPQVSRLKPKQRLVTRKVWQPTLTFEREKFRALMFEGAKTKKRERSIPVLKLPQVPEQGQVPKLKIPTPQIPETLQTPKIKIPTPQIPTQTFPKIPPLIKLGGGARGRGAEKRRFARWWRKQQKIKTPKQMLKIYFNDKLFKKAMETF